ncbi:LGFP repeat-containing protein, partial [Kineococcus indalonis]|uniref:LGFP repeat-containing protein n=1 Tax=Kineococcus indalonis TaxID=2696566 RepID=UPI001F0DAA37|nr:hypothetical protein [Kineococcus indalonis]
VHGEIRDGWGRLGWEGGYLGFPTGDEETTDSRRGRFQRFEGGAVHWAPWSGAHALRGAVLDAYDSYDDCTRQCVSAEDVLGFPVTSEIRTPNGLGAYNHFQWGSIYWSPATGAQLVRGEIRDAWARQGWENGPLGFPASAEEEYAAATRDDVKVQYFEHGAILWWPGGSEIHHF